MRPILRVPDHPIKLARFGAYLHDAWTPSWRLTLEGGGRFDAASEELETEADLPSGPTPVNDERDVGEGSGTSVRPGPSLLRPYILTQGRTGGPGARFPLQPGAVRRLGPRTGHRCVPGAAEPGAPRLGSLFVRADHHRAHGILHGSSLRHGRPYGNVRETPRVDRPLLTGPVAHAGRARG